MIYFINNSHFDDENGLKYFLDAAAKGRVKKFGVHFQHFKKIIQMASRGPKIILKA